MLSRKHYKAIAEIIRSEYTRFDNTGEDDYEAKHAIRVIVYDLGDYLGIDNPHFRRQKFLDACEL